MQTALQEAASGTFHPATAEHEFALAATVPPYTKSMRRPAVWCPLQNHLLIALMGRKGRKNSSLRVSCLLDLLFRSASAFDIDWTFSKIVDHLYSLALVCPP